MCSSAGGEIMAETKNVHVNVDLGIRRLLVIPVFVGFLLLVVLVYGYSSIVGNERLSLVAQGLAIAREMNAAADFEGWNQYTTGDWISRFIGVARSQGQESGVASDANVVVQYASAVDGLIADKVREGVRERVAMEVQVNYLRYPKAVDPHKLMEAVWRGMLLQHTVLPAITLTPTPSPTPTPEATALSEPTVVMAQPGQANCPVEWCGHTEEVPVGEVWDFPNTCLNPFRGKPDFSVNCRPSDVMPTPLPPLEGSSSWPTTSVMPTPTPTPMPGQTFSPTPAFRPEEKDLLTQAIDSWVDDGLPEWGFWLVCGLVFFLIALAVGIAVYLAQEHLIMTAKSLEKAITNLTRNTN
jgi:hypothetical protein